MTIILIQSFELGESKHVICKGLTLFQTKAEPQSSVSGIHD